MTDVESAIRKIVIINPRQAEALVILSHLGGATCSVLCRRMRAWTQPQTLHPLLSTLETIGLISARPHGISWGEWMWQITPRGEMVCRAARMARWPGRSTAQQHTTAQEDEE